MKNNKGIFYGRETHVKSQSLWLHQFFRNRE
jgi:hypothetical protein